MIYLKRLAHSQVGVKLVVLMHVAKEAANFATPQRAAAVQDAALHIARGAVRQDIEEGRLAIGTSRG